MSEVFRSSVFYAKEETTEGTLIAEGAANAIPIREGFSFQGSVETLASNELQNDIGASKPVKGRETPSCSFPKYMKHSGIEGTAPEYAILIKSAMGAQTNNSTQYDTVSGSTAGTASAAATVVVDSGEGANFAEGQALLIKDNASGRVHSIRNIDSISTDTLTLNFNLANAPGTGVNLGKAIHFSPASTGHPSFSAYHYQASSGSAFKQAIAGCKTTSMTLNFNAVQYAEINFNFEGIQFFFNPLTVTAGSNDDLDFNDGGVKLATIPAGTYNNPHALARAVQTAMDNQSTDNITCTYSDSTGKFTIASDGGTLTLLWNTGANTGTTIGTLLGFSVAADDSGATSYIADSALSFDPSNAPTYDSVDNVVVKSSELLLGDFDDITCREVSELSFTISTPKGDILSACSASGVDSTIIQSRAVTASCKLKLAQYESDLFDKFINNTSTKLMFNTGTKTGGNWNPGKCINVYMPNATLSGTVLAEQDGYVVWEIEATGFVDGDKKDIHINFV